LNTLQIAWLKDVVGEDQDGSIMSVLLRDDLHRCTFEGTARFLIAQLYEEKKQLVQENKRYADVLKKHRLYTPENILD